MAKPKLAINGFGRIGRLVARAALEKGTVDIVGINDLVSVETNAHLFKYDSNHGTWPGDVRAEGNTLIIDGHKIPCSQEKDPANLPHAANGADFVLESTGRFTKREDAAKHLTAGAKYVIISAPSSDPDFMTVLGVNDDKIPADARIISNASCTTNCLAPLVKVLHDKWGVVKGLVTTVHSYTNDQQVLDLAHKDMRRARAAGVNIIPTSTGAARAIGKVIPDLKGKLDGFSLRVPTPNVSVVDFVAELRATPTVEDVNAALKAAAESGPLKGYLGYEEKELVSRDYNHDSRSSIVDAKSTFAIDNMVKVVAWYDNEWGYSCRCVDLVTMLAKRK